MSSPIHHAKDLDAALVYAPPWARDREGGLPARPIASSLERPGRNWLTENGSGSFSGDRAMAELQRQLALNPDRAPEPPPGGASALWPFALRLCAVGGVAALVAWGLVLMTGEKKAVNETVQADIPPLPEAAPVPVNRIKLVEVRTATVVPVVQDRFATQDAPLPQPENPPAPQAANAPAPQLETVPAPHSSSPPTPSVTLALANDEMATLVKRGKDFLVNGDLASARLLLRRAAEAGSAEAALALGASFDPLVIARLGAIGAAPDVARARQWYQKAEELGSQDASQQLAKLVQASR